MKKKIFVMIIAFLGMCSVIYAQNNNLFAATSSSDFHKQLKVGDKILLGENGGSPVLWDVGAVNNQQYTLMSTMPITRKVPFCSKNTQNVFTNQSFIMSCNYIATSSSYENSAAYTEMKKFNDNAFSSLEKNVLENMSSLSNGGLEYAFIPRGSDFKSFLGIANIITGTAYTLSEEYYWISDFSIYSKASTTNGAVNQFATIIAYGTDPDTAYPDKATITEGLWATYAISSGKARAENIRAFSILNSQDIVFSLNKEINDTNLHEMITVKTAVNNQQTTNGLRIRVKSDANTTPVLKSMKDGKDKEVSVIANNETVYLEYEGTSSLSNQWITALMKEVNTGKEYYSRMALSSGNAKAGLNTEGLPVGNYKVYIVNETINDSDRIIQSSELSNAKELEIVSPISNLSFTPTSNLKYNANVNVSDTIGTITSSNGVGTPAYTLIADSSHANDVTKFEIGNDGKSVQIKGSALDAGTYYFKIQAQDGNGHPETPLEISATVTVAKGDITSIVFDNPNQTKKSISDAQTSWNETATSTPSSGIKVTYSIDSGNLNLLDIDANTGAITMKTTTGFGKVVIKASADDDPTSGKDNVNPKTITKDIIIYQNVDGSFTPDSASSDPNDPTFSASDVNVKGNGIIGSIAGTQGTPDNLTSGTITYTYTLKNESDYNYFVLSGSTLKVKNGVDLGVGSYTVKITVADKYGSKHVSVNINVGVAAAEKLDFYDDSNAIITSKGLSTPYGSKNIKVLAKGEDITNTNPITYSIEDGSTNIITVHPSSGVLSIHGVGTTKVKATKAGMSGQAEASQTMNVTITKGDQVDFKFVDYAGSNVQLPIKGDGSYEEYKDPSTNKLVPYTKNGSFQLHTNGANGTVTYALKAGSESDVITVDADGTIHIINATMKAKMNRVSVIATSIDDSGAYADKTIEIVVNIDQSEQTLSFVDQPIMIPHGNNVSVMPRFNSQNISNEDGSVLDTDIYLDQSTITYTNGTANVQVDSNDGVSLKSNYTGLAGVDGTIEAIKDGNRNYKQVKVIGTFHIMDPSENDFTISYPNEVIYGDTFAFTPRGDSTSTNVVYQITANTPAIADYNVTSKKASAKKVGEASFTIKRTADGEVEKEKTVKVQVKPKEILIQIGDASRLVGESNPIFTYEDFTSQLISWDMIQDSIQVSDIRLSTTASQTSPKGTYPITLDIAHLNETYPNYTFKSNKANLTILQDVIENGWYHMEIEDRTPYANTWTNQSVKIIADHAQYTEISIDRSTWNPEVLVSQEGKNEIKFYMRKASGAISEVQTENIFIDKNPPEISSIKGTQTKKSRAADFLNLFTFNSYYKPGVVVEIQGKDVPLNESIEMSGLQSITYELFKSEESTPLKTETKNTTSTINFTIEEPGTYKVCATAKDNTDNISTKKCENIEVKKIDIDVDGDGENDFLDPDEDGCADLNIVWKNDDNTWTKLNVDRDKDDIPDMDIDSKGSGKADLNVDSDHDGKPDLNLVILTKEDWKPTICVTTQPEVYCTGTSMKAKINVDLADENGVFDDIPDINIDDDGDMKADINITKPNEIKPFLNITSKHSSWKPNKDATFEKFEYDTDDSWKAILNVDSDDDGKPDLNIDFNDDGKPELNIDANDDGVPETDIDGDGDGIRDINIDTDSDGTADENIFEIKTWKPDIDGDKDGVIFDTMIGINGKDKLEDNDVVIEKPGGVFLPNYALKVDRITDSANELIKKDIINKSVGQVIVEIYDVKLLEDDVQIQPDGKLRIRLPMPEGIINPRLVIQQADGTYFKVKPEIKDGYLYYESDYLGLVSIVGDHEAVDIPDNELNTPDSGGAYEPNTSVKGTYTTTGTNTGDNSDVLSFITMLLIGSLSLILVGKRLFKNTI